MRKLYALLFSLFAFITSNYAQQSVNNYTFAETSSAYTAISGGTVSTATGDDGTQNLAIGFPFVFGGTAYPNVVITTNGALKLAADGSVTFGSSWVNGLSNTLGFPLIGVIWDDHNQSGGNVVYQLSGSAPNRTFSVEWQNIHIGGGGSSSNPTGTFRVTLFETTNVIQMQYGTINGYTSVSASIGLNDLTNFLSVTPGTPATVSSATANNNISNGTGIVSGTTYTFTPPPLPAVDAGPTGIVVPATVCTNNTPVTVQVVVKNLGSAPLNFATNPLSVTVNVTGATTATLTANVNTGTLAVGSTMNVAVAPTITFNTAGAYNFAVTATVTGDGNNSNNTYNTSQSINGTPTPVVVPANPRICAGSIQMLTTSSTPSPVVTSSGPITVNVPDASAVGITSTLNVSGLPSGATVTAVAVSFNMTHTFDGDMIFNLKAPNGNVLNLINQRGGSGDNFVNTVISSTASTPIGSGTSPFTGSFLPDGTNALAGSAGIVSNVTTFAGLYSVGNGGWILSMRDAAGGDFGILTDWSISITFTPPNTVWTPTIGLFTDAAAGTPYTIGTNAPTLYAKPTTSTTYNLVATSGAGCIGTSTVTVLVDNTPVPVIVPTTATICRGDIQPITSNSSSTARVSTATSGTINVAVPDNNAAGITSAITMSGIPAGAIITNIATNFNMAHTFDGDMIINLQGPNGNILNLINQRGGSGDNFVNTFIDSHAGLPGVSTGVAPFSATYAPDGTNAVGPTAFPSNVINYTGLFSVPNGTWTLAMRDAANGDFGFLTSWSVTIYYMVPDAITWTPITGLYTDALATTAYVAGANTSTIYAKPLVTTTYGAISTTLAGCNTTVNSVITVNQPPSVTGQPVNQNICPTQTGTFTVTATGAGLTYQWRKNGTPLANGGNISGVNTATLTISNAVLADGGNYDVVITGTCNPSATSNVGVLAVGAAPILTGQPQSQIACAGNTVSFTVAAAGVGNTYVWRKNGTPLVNGGNISGATTATLTVSNISATDAGNYDVIVTNVCSQSSTSTAAVLTFTTTDRWLGTSNTDWNNPLNWCNGVPTSTTDVQILSGTLFAPVISATNDVRNLQVDAGATLNISASGWLNIYGSTLTLNGSFIPTPGTISFRNTANLNVPALTVSNVVMNGAGGITMTGNLTVNTALTLTNGNITLGNNNLVMTGGTVGSAASHVVTNGTGVVTMTVNVPTVVFPVGPTAASYNPVWVANGQALSYSIRVATGVPGTLANGARAINRTWTVTPSGAPANPVSLNFGYADVDANASCTPTANMEIGSLTGTTWTIVTPAGGVLPAGTATQRTAFTTSRSFGTMVVANVGGVLTPTGTPNLDADIYSVKLMPNLVNEQSTLRVMSRRSMNVDWTVTDIQGRIVMKFSHGVMAGQNDMTLRLGHLATGSYQVVGYTDKGATNVIKFVKM
jgi:subtilisin-like proprotein convertase family protein